MADKTVWCPGCARNVDEEKCASLDGYNNTVCFECWRGMTPFERILLHILATPGFDSANGLGLGIGYEANGILNLAERFFRIYHGHGPDVSCRQCDPNRWAGMQLDREQAAKAAKAAKSGTLDRREVSG